MGALMGGFPALAIRPPESPVQQLGGVLQLKNAVQQQQLGEIQLQEARLNQESQQVLMQKFSENNGDLNKTYADAANTGRVTPQMLLQFRTQSIAAQTAMASLSDKEMEVHRKTFDLSTNEFESLKGITDEGQFQTALKASVGRILQAGADPQSVLPFAQQLAQDHSPAGFARVETAMKGPDWLISHEEELRKQRQAPTDAEAEAQRVATLHETENKALQSAAETSLAIEKQRQLGKVTPEEVYKQQQENYRATLARQATFANNLQSSGLKQLDSLFSDPQHGYVQFLSQVQNGKNLVMQARNGSELAASLEPTMVALGLSSFAGIHRVSPTEAAAAGPQVGSIARKINSILDKVGTGSVPEDTLKEVESLLDGMVDAKHNATLGAANMVVANTGAAGGGGGLDPKRVMVMDRNGVLKTLSDVNAEKGKTPEQAAPATTRKVGDIVSIKGKQMKITKLYPDGSFDAE
jgi:hypothetical protein